MAVLLVVFVLLRLMPTPEVLEPYGFYRGRSDEGEWASRPMQYADPVRCNECHQDRHDIWAKSAHSTVSCENCHGPGETHVEGKASLVVDTSRESCEVCHARLLARPSDFPQVDLEQHGEQSTCITCHKPHNPSVATLPVIPPALEGHADCLLCHNTGGIEPFPEDHEGRSRNACLSCHRSK